MNIIIVVSLVFIIWIGSLWLYNDEDTKKQKSISNPDFNKFYNKYIKPLKRKGVKETSIVYNFIRKTYRYPGSDDSYHYNDNFSKLLEEFNLKISATEPSSRTGEIIYKILLEETK